MKKTFYIFIMAKQVKSIICPQCHATEAEQLDDGTFVCKYCCTRFFIDDDTVTQNINVNVNVNVNHKNVPQPEPQYRLQQGSLPSWLDKKTRWLLFFISLFFLLPPFICESLDKKVHPTENTDPKQAGTLSANLPKGERVYDSWPVDCNGRPAFWVLTKDNKYKPNHYLRIVYASDFEVVTLDVPPNLVLFDKGVATDNLFLASDKKIYRFDMPTLKFYDYTDTILALNDELKNSELLKVSRSEEVRGFDFVTANGEKFCYVSCEKKILKAPLPKNNAPTPAKRTVRTEYVMCGESNLKNQDLYKITINDSGMETNRKWKAKILNFKSLNKTAKQLNSDIISFNCIKKLGFNSSQIIYSDSLNLYISYVLDGIEFLRKTDLKGEEIWTQKLPEHYEPSMDYASGISGEKNCEFGDGILLKSHTSHTDYNYIFIHNNGSIRYIRMRDGYNR